MPDVRVSIANLAWYVVIDHKRQNIAVCDKNEFAKGARVWQALGGAAMLTLAGKRALQTHFDAHEFEVDKNTGLTDARFMVDESKLDAVFAFCATMDIMHEKDPIGDIMQELFEDRWHNAPPLLHEKFKPYVRYKFMPCVHQATPHVGADMSKRTIEGIPTRRMFRICKLYMPTEAHEALFAHPAVCSLLDTELATTDGGRAKGNRQNGEVIKNNLFIPESRTA